jgi:hypothetical protein
MSSIRPRFWFSLFQAGTRKGGPPAAEVRPSLEPLEDRVVPALIPFIPTGTVINPIGPSIFSLFNQSETVTTQTNIAGTNDPATAGQVTITDGGQTHIVPVTSSGQATTTFTFSFFQEQVKPHPVNAHFSDSSGAFASSTANTVQAPDNTIGYLFQIYFDYYLYLSLTAPPPQQHH